MKINRFNEKYNIDLDSDDIAIEYAKHIISEFIDKENEGITLEKVFYDIVKGDEIDKIEMESHVKVEIVFYLDYLLKEAKKIRKIPQIEADKFNL